jgi:citrate lyase beta subunit
MSSPPRASNAASDAAEGVVLVDGRMVDRPVVERARRILATTHRTPGDSA